MTRHLPWLLFACAGLLLLQPRTAHAGSFDLSPISVTLSVKVPSAMLTVRNRGTEALRFHVAAYSWDEAPDGEMILKPTSDIVFFPAMLVLNAGEARKLRVGMNAPPGAAEKTYRIFVQELPALAKKGDEGTAVRMLTKMGVPVFVEGPAPKPAPKVSALRVEGSKVKFSLGNSGNAHYRPEKIFVKSSAGGKLLDTQEVSGWYVLAGRTRDYAVNLPKTACEGLTSIDVELVLADRSVKAALADARCTP
jgi:fimbrial chaperone protein